MTGVGLSAMARILAGGGGCAERRRFGAAWRGSGAPGRPLGRPWTRPIDPTHRPPILAVRSERPYNLPRVATEDRNGAEVGGERAGCARSGTGPDLPSLGCAYGQTPHRARREGTGDQPAMRRRLRAAGRTRRGQVRAGTRSVAARRRGRTAGAR